MTQLNMDNELYEKVREFVEIDKIEYPSIINFVEKAVRDKLRIETINMKESQR
jgi:hypothetical protein